MIAKKVKNPKKGGTKSARVSGLVKYVREPHHENKLEKCIYQGERNFMFGADNAIEEMTALAEEAKRSADPIAHYVLSWQEGERPTPEQIEQAVDIFLSRMGLIDHQCIYGLHNDTDNMHLHIVVNRVHPDTLQVTRINRGFDIEVAHQAIAEIEHAQGWKREENGRYEIAKNGELVKVGQSQRQQPDSVTRDQEVRTGERSAQRIAIEDAAPIIQRAASWRQLHEELAAIGMRYERQGSGAVIFVGDVAVKASTADRNATIGKLQARLGAYQSAHAVTLQESHYERITIPTVPRLLQRNLAEVKTLSEHHLRDLQGRSLAPDASRKQNPRVLPVNVGNSGRTSERVRRADDDRSRGDRPARGLTHSPDFVRYSSRKQQYTEAKREAWSELKGQQTDERKALRERQAADRKETLAGNWRGKGALLNAMKSIIAAQQAAEKLELKERQEAEKKRVREAYPPFPTFESWLRRHVGHEAAEDYRKPDLENEARIYGEIRQVLVLEHKPRPVDIRDYKPRIQGREVRYQSASGREDFIDKGRNIAMLNEHDPDAVRAALQLASTKFGGKVHLTGNDQFKVLACRLAAQEGITVLNPELQNTYNQERGKIEAERQARLAAEREAAAKVAALQAKLEAEKKAQIEAERAREVPPEPAPTIKAQPKTKVQSRAKGPSRGRR